MGVVIDPAEVVRRYRAISVAHAHFLQGLHELLSETEDYDSDQEEVRVGILVTAARMRKFTDLAEALAGKLAGTGEALACGGIDVEKAELLFSLTKPLDAELAQQVEEQVLPTAHELSNSAMRALGERTIHELDPSGAEERHQRCKKDRSLSIAKKPHGMGELRLYSAIDEVESAYRQIDQQVRNTRAADDERTPDQARADLAAAVLAAGGAAVEGFQPTVNATVVVEIPHDVLLGLRDSGAEIHGYGPVPGPGIDVASDVLKLTVSGTQPS